jgi:hypothetical protein
MYREIAKWWITHRLGNMSSPKLDIFKMLNAIDSKDYDFYDNLTDDERKGFSAYIGLKWGASVSGGDNILQHYYLASMNSYVNVNLFDLNKHHKLQWLLLVASSPNFGVHRHEWIYPKKKPTSKSKNDIKSQLMKIYPSYKEDDIELLASMVTKKDLKKFVKDCGDE